MVSEATTAPLRPRSRSRSKDDFRGLEVDFVSVCGLDLRVLRRRSDFFSAVAGDLPIMSTGLVLWECGMLLADYLGYARWLGSEEGAMPPHPWWQLHQPAPVVPSRYWQKRKVLELGGGCGLVAIALASLGAHIVCTDGDTAALRTAKQNAAESKRRYSQEWGFADFLELSFSDGDAARTIMQDHGPFEYIVGSDLLYGDRAPPEALVEVLAALSSAPGGEGAQIILAAKNRCADEVRVFCRLAEKRGLWDIRLADPVEFLEGFGGKCTYGEDQEGPAYNIIHLTRRSEVPR